MVARGVSHHLQQIMLALVKLSDGSSGLQGLHDLFSLPVPL